VSQALKAQHRAHQFRLHAAELLKGCDWLDVGLRYWLQKQLDRPRDHLFTEIEHNWLAQIIAASTLFDGWDGHTVPELIAVAWRHTAQLDYQTRSQFKVLQGLRRMRLRLAEMELLVRICRETAGVPLAPFRPASERYDAAA
jgi:hypothetical protein